MDNEDLLDDLEDDIEGLESDFEDLKDESADGDLRDKQKRAEDLLNKIHEQLSFLREQVEKEKE